MNLIREILLDISNNFPNGKEYDYPKHCHIALCIDGGFITKERTVDNTNVVYNLTWTGHEFLAKYNDTEVWNAILKFIKDVEMTPSMWLIDTLYTHALEKVINDLNDKPVL